MEKLIIKALKWTHHDFKIEKEANDFLLTLLSKFERRLEAEDFSELYSRLPQLLAGDLNKTFRSSLKKETSLKELQTAILEYLATEILELSGNCSRDEERDEISVQDILKSIRNDEELSLTLKNYLS